MAIDDIANVLRECEALVSGVSPELRAPAFHVLLSSRLADLKGVAADTVQREVTGSRNASSGFKAATSVREKIIVAMFAADPANDGLNIPAIKESLTRFRQKMPGNLARDIGLLVRAGLVLPLEGAGRSAVYALSQEGLDVLERLFAVNP